MKRKPLFYLLSIIPLVLFNCSKSIYDTSQLTEFNLKKKLLINEPENPFEGLSDSVSFIIISTSKIEIDQDENPQLRQEESTVVIWKKNSKSKLKIKDPLEALKGVAYDSISNEPIRTNLILNGSYIFLQDYPPGEYLVTVIINDKIKSGKNSYSSKEIILDKTSKIYLHKIFSPNIKNYEYESWTSNISNYEN